MSADAHPTNEEIQRVRRYECSIGGHSWDYIVTIGHEDPVAIVCTNCGRVVEIPERIEQATQAPGELR